MTIERTEEEIIVKLSSKVNLSELQATLDYLRYCELTAGSKATQANVDVLVKEVNKSMWEKFKKERNF